MWRLLAPASGQQVRKDDDYQNTSRHPWTSRTGVFLLTKLTATGWAEEWATIEGGGACV